MHSLSLILLINHLHHLSVAETVVLGKAIQAWHQIRMHPQYPTHFMFLSFFLFYVLFCGVLLIVIGRTVTRPNFILSSMNVETSFFSLFLWKAYLSKSLCDFHFHLEKVVVHLCAPLMSCVLHVGKD